MSTARLPVAFVLAVTLLLAAGCGGGSGPEERLRETIRDMEAAAEAGERARFLRFVAADFAGPDMATDREGLGELLRIQLLARTRVNALVTDLEITLHGDRATAAMRALVTGGPRAWLPESGNLYRVETGWRLEGGQWRLLSADWEPVLGAG